MLLAIDIGNTSTVLGVFSGEELVAHFRIHTDRMRMESEYRVILKNLFALEDLPPPKAALLSSVVPPVEREMKEAIERLFGIKAQVVDAGATGLEVCIDNPKEAGTDRLVNAVGALGYESPTGRYIVVDFGTATTFDLVEAPNRYLGGAITIGPQTAADALAARTAKLPRIDLVPPHPGGGQEHPGRPALGPGPGLCRLGGGHGTPLQGGSRGSPGDRHRGLCGNPKGSLPFL